MIYVLWTTRNGQKQWDGPFDSMARAEGAAEMNLHVREGGAIFAAGIEGVQAVDEAWHRKFGWPWPGKTVEDVVDEQIAAFLRSRHLDYPIGANRRELLGALAAAGYEVPA